MSHSEKPLCGKCGRQWIKSRHWNGHTRKKHSDDCARDQDCKCPPLHPWCSEEVRAESRPNAKIRVLGVEFAARVTLCCGQMRPDRVHHPPKDHSLITEALPNKSMIVTHRAANGKPLSV